MRKQIKRALCAMLCFTAAFTPLSLSACSSFWTGSLPSFMRDSQSSGDDSSSESSSVNDSEKDEPTPPVTPPPTLIREETDSLGHKIGYYSDGTWKDLGRVTPLDFTPRAAEDRYGYQGFLTEKNADDLCAFYIDLYDAATGFFKSTADVHKDGRDYYSIAAVDYAEYDLTGEEMTAVGKMFKQDHPEFYWLADIGYVYGSEFYLCIDEAYSLNTVREETQEAIEKAALECDAYLNGKMSMTERAVTVHDYLAATIGYAYEEDGTTPSDELWAHNIVGWATRGEGVCETYAEAFSYLCGLFGLESSVVVGNALQAGEMTRHAWNILKLDDEWHTVDVTWSDSYEGYSDTLIGREWFGKGAVEFLLTHVADSPANGWGIEYQFELPALAEESLSPVLLSENDGEAEMIVSIDKAFEKMTNGDSRYEITLYPSTNATVEKGFVIYPIGAAFSSDPPAVKELSITGTPWTINEETEFRLMAEVKAKKALTLAGDLTVDSWVSFEAESLHLGTHTLKLQGAVYLYSNETITGDEGACLVSVDVEGRNNGAEVYAAIDLPKVEVFYGLTLRKGGRIGELRLHESPFVAWGEYDLAVEEVYRSQQSGNNIAIEWATAETQITLGNIHVTEEETHEEPNSMFLVVSFKDAKEYPQIFLTGTVEGKIDFSLNGKKITETTDWEGNIIDRQETLAYPEDISVPIIHVTDPFAWFNLNIYFTEWKEGNGAGEWISKKHLYERRHSGDVCLKA